MSGLEPESECSIFYDRARGPGEVSFVGEGEIGNLEEQLAEQVAGLEDLKR